MEVSGKEKLEKSDLKFEKSYNRSKGELTRSPKQPLPPLPNRRPLFLHPEIRLLHSAELAPYPFDGFDHAAGKVEGL